jgi:tetratricopeptide (TPR) repeat protein
MTRPIRLRHASVLALLCVFAASARAQAPADTFTNLKVLPKDIAPQELRTVMGSFTRALGVRCVYCHVGEEGKPIRHEDFPKDDKLTKRKAREMLRMVNDINGTYLAKLEGRSDPPVRVECMTCHHGVPEPRTLQDLLQQSYEHGGLDSTIARYHALRDRYYGRAAYDFGEVPLADVAGRLWIGGHEADAARLDELNVEMNPNSAFAKRQHAALAIGLGFSGASADSGAAAYRTLQQRYGPAVVSEGLLSDVGHALLRQHRVEPALAAFKLEAAENPGSAGAFANLGEAYEQQDDRKLAAQAYAKALALDPANDEVRRKVEELKAKPRRKGK